MNGVHPYLEGLDGPARVAFALAYPFDVAAASFLLEEGVVRPFDARAARLAAEPGRVLVLACGSNAAPSQLARKFKATPGAVPTLRGRLEGFQTVHTAKFTAYGAMPASLMRVDGAATTVFVNCLDAAQLRRMHETEALGVEYHFRRLEGLSLRLEDGARLTTAHAYVSLAGAFAPEGRALALAAIDQAGPLASLSQAEVQEAARARLAPGETLPAFIDRTICDAAVRAHRIGALQAAYALPIGAGDGII